MLRTGLHLSKKEFLIKLECFVTFQMLRTFLSKSRFLLTANDYRKKLNEKKTAFAQTVIAKERPSKSFVTY